MGEKKNPSRNLVNENYIFIQAFHLYQDAVKAEKANFIRALNLYKQALALIDSIPERFPSSSLAIKVAQRQIRLGRCSYDGIRKRILRLRVKAAREELLTILHDCAMNLKAADLRAENLGEVALQIWNNNQKEFAQKVFSESLEAIENIESHLIKNNSLSILAVKYAEIGEFERALTLSIYFSETSDQIRLLTDLGVAYFGKNMRERAKQLFNSALELSEREPDPEKSAGSRAWVAFKLAESREFFWAIEVSESIEDGDARIAIIHKIADKLIEFGKFATIQEIIKKISDKYIKSELMTSMVMRYADDGYSSQAREFADSIEVPSLKARAYLALAKEFKGKKLLQVALEFVDSAVKIAHQEPNIEDKVFILASAATISSEFREEKRACDLVRSALEEIECLEKGQKRSEFLTYLVEICIEIGQISQAREILARIEEIEPRNKAMVELCSKFARLDKIDDAMELAKGIDDANYRIKAFFQIIDKNPDNRNFKLKNDLIAQIIETAINNAAKEYSDRTLADCALLVAGFEKFHQAFQLLEQIVSEPVRNELIWALAESKFKSDFFVEGIEIIRLISNSDVRITRLIQLGLAILKGDFPESTFKVEDFLPIAFSFWLEEKEAFDLNALDKN